MMRYTRCGLCSVVLYKLYDMVSAGSNTTNEQELHEVPTIPTSLSAFSTYTAFTDTMPSAFLGIHTTFPGLVSGNGIYQGSRCTVYFAWNQQPQQRVAAGTIARILSNQKPFLLREYLHIPGIAVLIQLTSAICISNRCTKLYMRISLFRVRNICVYLHIPVEICRVGIALLQYSTHTATNCYPMRCYS